MVRAAWPTRRSRPAGASSTRGPNLVCRWRRRICGYGRTGVRSTIHLAVRPRRLVRSTSGAPQRAYWRAIDSSAVDLLHVFVTHGAVRRDRFVDPSDGLVPHVLGVTQRRVPSVPRGLEHGGVLGVVEASQANRVRTVVCLADGSLDPLGAGDDALNHGRRAYEAARSDQDRQPLQFRFLVRSILDANLRSYLTSGRRIDSHRMRSLGRRRARFIAQSDLPGSLPDQAGAAELRARGCRCASRVSTD
jgi:hypothetical protein